MRDWPQFNRRVCTPSATELRLIWTVTVID
jgi:hypothetical protein